MLTKGAIGNLVNRYRAVLKKCNLMNTFGSLAVASMLVLGGAGVAEAVTYNSQYDPAGTIDLSTVDGEFIVHSPSSNWAMFPSKTFEIGVDKTLGKIEVIGKTAMLLGSNGSMTADSIYLKGETSNGITLYGELTLTGNNITIESKYNAVQIDDKKSSMTINGGNVTISTEQHIALHGANGGNITVNADSLTINAPKAIQTMSEGSSVTVNATVADINGDIVTGGKNTSLSLSFDEGTLTGRLATRSDNTGSSGTTLVLGEKATWILTDGNKFETNPIYYGAGFGDSEVKNLTVNGTIDMSQVDRNITVTDSLSGDATVIMDAAKENKLDASNADTTEATIKAIATGDADTVSKTQASNMADRLAGVESKTVEVATGLVNNGFTMDGEGNIVAGGGASSVTKAVLEAASVNTVSLDRILTNDVRKRMGDLRSDKNEAGVWMRWDGGKLKGDSGLTNNFNTIQIGGDTKVAKNCRLGVAGSFTHGDSEFDRGNGQLEGFSFATYATWMADNGMFADVVARLGKFSTEMNVEGLKGDMDNRVFSLSGEYGWRFDLCNQFFVEPQVELAYTYVSSDDLQFGNATYQFDNVDSLTGRAGLVAGWNLPNDMGNVYARASVLQQFMGDAKVTGHTAAGATIHETDGDDTWLEYGIGANVKLTDKINVWADVERTEGADIEEEWRGTVGLRYSF